MTSTTTIADVASKIAGVTNRGAWTSTPTSSGKVTVPAGYHNGSGYVDTSKVYNAGQTANNITYKDFTSSVTMNKTVSGQWGNVSGSSSTSVAYSGYTPIGCGLIKVTISYNGSGGVYGVNITPSLSGTTLKVSYSMGVAVNNAISQSAGSTIRVYYKSN